MYGDITVTQYNKDDTIELCTEVEIQDSTRTDIFIFTGSFTSGRPVYYNKETSGYLHIPDRLSVWAVDVVINSGYSTVNSEVGARTLNPADIKTWNLDITVRCNNLEMIKFAEL